MRAVTIMHGDDVGLTASQRSDGTVVDQTKPGWHIPLDTLAVDPASYAAVVQGGGVVAAALTQSGTAVLGATSAGMRRLDAGGTVEIDNTVRLTVTAVVPDSVIAAAELVVSYNTGIDIGVTTPRAALLRYVADRAQLERAITALLPTRTAARFRGPGETTFLRHGDAVLAQVFVKQLFGEFALRPRGASALELDPAWVDANIVDAEVPVLGHARCHRRVVAALSGAIGELVDAGLTRLIDTASFGGCYNPRLIGPGLGISRHAWGIAVDLNVSTNPLGGASRQDPRLVEIMRRWGLAWGGEWLRADPMHFEYLTPPR